MKKQKSATLVKKSSNKKKNTDDKNYHKVKAHCHLYRRN